MILNGETFIVNNLNMTLNEPVKIHTQLME